MDDLILISHCKKELQNCLCQIESTLKTLKLELNNKTTIMPLKQRLEFLGATYHIMGNGKIYLRVKRHTRDRFKKAYKFSKIIGNVLYQQGLLAGMKGHLKGFDINLQKMLCSL